MFRKANTKSDLDPVRVLLIDADPGYTKLLEAWFRKHSANFTLATADHLSGALHSLEEEPADVVLVDLFLQDSSGLNTLTKIYETSPDAAVIVLTEIDDADVTIAALEQCAQKYLVKERIDSLHLFDAIREALDGRNASRERSKAELEMDETVRNSTVAIECWHHFQDDAARHIHTRSRILRIVPRIC